MNVAADQAAQANSLLALFKAVAEGGDAAQKAGLTFDPEPILKMWGTPEFAQIFKASPAQLGAKFMQAAQANPSVIPPELALQIVTMLQPLAHQAALQMAAQQQQAAAGAGGAPGGAQPPQGAAAQPAAA
jgi:hypothetical protein